MLYILFEIGDEKMRDEISYYAHLYNSLIYNKNNSLDQKSNLGEWINKIDGYDYEESIERWYSQLFEKIGERPPEFYVETLIVYESEEGNVTSICYSYYNNKITTQSLKNSGIIMFRDIKNSDLFAK